MRGSALAGLGRHLHAVGLALQRLPLPLPRHKGSVVARVQQGQALHHRGTAALLVLLVLLVLVVLVGAGSLWGEGSGHGTGGRGAGRSVGAATR